MPNKINQGKATKFNDTWLSPPELVKALGRFDLDPCCPPSMPWRTAKRMLTEKECGLRTEWVGRVWCNPPYSDTLPWIDKMAAHGDGIMLVSAKSSDTKWCQRLFSTAHAFYFLKGRLLFHYVSGEKSSGKWSPYLLAAFGKDNVGALRDEKFRTSYPGVLMRRSR